MNETTSSAYSHSSYFYDEEVITRNFGVLIPLGIVCLAGILGNFLFCTVVFVDRSLSKQKSNILLLLMCFGDIIVLVSRYLVSFYIEGPSIMFWPWSHTLCYIRHSFPIFAQALCIFSLTACSIERYLGVVKFPLGNTATNPWLFTVASVNVIVIGSLVMAGLSWWWAEMQIYGEYGVCVIANIHHPNYRWYLLVHFLITYVVPLCIVCFCYFSIVRCIMRSSMMHKNRECQPSVRKSLAKRKHGVVLLLVITLSFAILWLPHHVAVLCIAFRDHGPPGPHDQIMKGFYHYSNVANSALDPVLIFVLSSEHRNAAHDVIFCKILGRHRRRRYDVRGTTTIQNNTVSSGASAASSGKANIATTTM